MKVKAAVLNIFPDSEFAEAEGLLRAEASSLDRLKELFRKQAIRDSARHVLRDSIVGSNLRFSLNKQAAYMGKANFAPPSPMGAIDVMIESEDADGIIDFLTVKPESKMRIGPRI